MPVVSIDLATRRYSDIGIAMLAQHNESITVDFVQPAKYGLVE